MSAVPYVRLDVEPGPLRQALLAAVEAVLASGQFILGEAVERFERRFAAFCGVAHAIGVANGTDALSLALRALGVGPGDEVVTVPNSFLASASSIALIGAKPVFVDVGPDGNLDPGQLHDALGARTRAIVPVHLTGRPAEIDAIRDVARHHGVPILEDAAQAVGARYRGRPVGSLGRLAAFSLHPLKNLGAAGDGGVITTDDAELARWLRTARNHGLATRDEAAFWSPNSRLDALQAGLLEVKLDRLEAWTQARREHARAYREALADVVRVPDEPAHLHCVYHTFVIQAERRDALREYLAGRGIETRVHYPVPIHLQPAAAGLGYAKGDFPEAEAQCARIVSLPVYPDLQPEQRAVVIDAIRSFYGAGGRA
jgi:dTDP-4-amino-4,6-dideoxygalactose transaminase